MSESSVGITGVVMAIAIFLWRSGLIQILFEKWMAKKAGSPLAVSPGKALDRLRKLMDERRNLRAKKKDGDSRLKNLETEIADLRKLVLDDDKEE